MKATYEPRFNDVITCKADGYFVSLILIFLLACFSASSKAVSVERACEYIMCVKFGWTNSLKFFFAVVNAQGIRLAVIEMETIESSE